MATLEMPAVALRHKNLNEMFQQTPTGVAPERDNDEVK
jgi:hypothetical protein